MKQFIVLLIILLIFYSCRLNSKINPSLTNTFETLETQMGELRDEPDIEISKKDSSEFLKFWREFYKNYKENNIQNLLSLSLDSVSSPVFLEKEQRFQQESINISTNDFIKAQIWNKPPIEPYSNSKTDQSFIYYWYEFNPDTTIKKRIQDSVILNYNVLVSSKEIKGNYEFRNLFLLSFIRRNNSIRFTGMGIYGESYPMLVNDSATRSKLYFPLYRKIQDSIKNVNALDTFTNLWYSAELTEFKEPNLYTYSGEDDVYRFTWLRSFHNPVVIRFQKHENEYILTTKEMPDNGKYIPNEFVVNSSQHLSTAKWDKLEFKLGRMNFWNMVTLDPEPRPMDGADWIFEAKVNGRYHFVTRQFGEIDFRECCKYLLQLSKLKIREDDIY